MHNYYADFYCFYCCLNPGNSPGLCGDGTNSVDCYQESFVNCADVAIRAQ